MLWRGADGPSSGPSYWDIGASVEHLVERVNVRSTGESADSNNNMALSWSFMLRTRFPGVEQVAKFANT